MCFILTESNYYPPKDWDKHTVWYTKICIANCHICLTSGGEMLSVAEPFLEQQMHPTVIISAFRLALEDLLETLKKKIRYPSLAESTYMLTVS